MAIKTRKPRSSKSEIFVKKANKLLPRAVSTLKALASLTDKYSPTEKQTEVILNAVNQTHSAFLDAYSVKEETEQDNDLTVPVE